MKPVQTFLFSMTSTAALVIAGQFVIGSGETGTRPLAKSLGVATVNECKVTGRIESRTNGVFAVFDFENASPQEKEMKLNYLVTLTPAMSMMSRMMPQAKPVKKGTLEYNVKSGHTTEDVLLKEPDPVPAPDPATTNALSRISASALKGIGMQPEIWTLVVSRGEIKGLHGWGAVVPTPSDSVINLDKGEAVLASTILEKATP